MNPHYKKLYRALLAGEALEKTASLNDKELASQAVVAGALLAADLYEQVVKLAGANQALPFVDVVMDLRAKHRLVGEKRAGEEVEAAQCLQKLATAVFLDNALTTAMQKLAGEELVEARLTRTLGREYAIHLVRGLLS